MLWIFLPDKKNNANDDGGKNDTGDQLSDGEFAGKENFRGTVRTANDSNGEKRHRMPPFLKVC